MADLVAVIVDSKVVNVLDREDHCNPYAGGDYQGHCGGCDRCMIMQYKHWGHTLKDVTLQEHETLGDAVGRMNDAPT
jgi:hypothetical protein